MIREHIIHQLDHDPHFQWRGDSVTRIENLSDIVFALALGMLVSASTPPTTYQQLLPHLANIIPVAAGLTVLFSIWNAHFTYFRRYGVADSRIIFLNAALLLLILFVAYPLRFVFDSLFAFILGQSGDWTRMTEMGISNYRQAGVISGYFCIGFAVVNALLHAMYLHAHAKSDLLALTATERAITRRSIWRFRFEVLISSVAAVLAIFTLIGPFAGLLLLLSRPANIIIGRSIKLPMQAGEEIDDGLLEGRITKER